MGIVQIARHYPEVLKIFDIDDMPLSSDPQLNALIEVWSTLDKEVRDEIIELGIGGEEPQN